ncbi:hypothetical protein [Micromonospora sp. I033]
MVFVSLTVGAIAAATASHVGRDGQPTAIWITYLPFLLPFGFHFG